VFLVSVESRRVVHSSTNCSYAFVLDSCGLQAKSIYAGVFLDSRKMFVSGRFTLLFAFLLLRTERLLPHNSRKEYHCTNPIFNLLKSFHQPPFSKPILPTLFKEASERDLAAHFTQGRDGIAPKSGKRVREFMLFEHDVIHSKSPIDVRINTVFVIIWCTTVVNARLTSSAPRNGSQWQ
jgi:hypothetical protein